MPMDGLALFIGNTWDKIRTQKELNLPDQRIMVANLRCGELKDEALSLVLPKCQTLKQECDKAVVENFQERCTGLLKSAIDHFDEYAQQYDKTVYSKTKKELITVLIN